MKRGVYSERTERFTELLSQEWSIPDIRKELGLSNGAAQGLMTRIRTRLGPQAV